MGEFTWVIFDALALVILITAVARSAHSGFVKGILGLVSTALSAVAAFWLSASIAGFIYERFLRTVIVSAIYTRLTEQAQEGAGGLLALLLAGIIIAAAGAIDPADFSGALPALEGAIDAAVAPPIITLLRVVFTVLLFIIFLLVSRRVVSVFRAINRIPLVGPVNSALGGLLGVGWAALILWGLALLGSFYIAVSSGGGGIINSGSLGGGYLFSFFFRMIGST